MALILIILPREKLNLAVNIAVFLLNVLQDRNLSPTGVRSDIKNTCVHINEDGVEHRELHTSWPLLCYVTEHTHTALHGTIIYLIFM